MAKTAELIKETITIERNGNWGPMVGGVYYGLNEPLTKDNFVVGNNYEVLVKQSNPTPKYPTGKKYITQIIGEVQPQQPLSVSSTVAKQTVTPKAAVTSGFSKPRDFDAEARGKTRAQQHAAALMSPAIAGLQINNIEDLLAHVRRAADEGVAYTFEEREG